MEDDKRSSAGTSEVQRETFVDRVKKDFPEMVEDLGRPKLPLELWLTWARRDDWHERFVGSDIRQMLGEIQRLREHFDNLPSQPQQSADTAQEPPLPDGAIRAVAYIDKLPSGLWMFWSPQWRGMILAHSNPSLMFGELPTVGKRLFETMRDRHAKQPYSDASQIAQMERYKAFFADVTINEPQAVPVSGGDNNG